MCKRGAILIENVIFIVLNLVFLSILFLFVFSKMGSAAILEERYAKEIALLIDGAKPGMKISLNIENALNKKDKNWNGKIISIQDNIVTVRLREKGGYSYSFFNDVDFDKLYHLSENGNYFELKVLKKQNEKVE
ncbi:MAG: hypothetical protein ABH811_00340 [archaeon]